MFGKRYFGNRYFGFRYFGPEGEDKATGALEVTEADDTLAASGALLILGSLTAQEEDDEAQSTAIALPHFDERQFVKVRYEAPAKMIARHEQSPVMKARKEPRTFKAQRLAA